MKYLAVTLIFWVAIWTVPKAVGTGLGLWVFRAVVIAWGFYLCRKILNQTNNTP